MLQSYNYAKTWKNSLTLWENVLSIYPTSDIALLNYGNALRNEKQYKRAIENYNKVSKQGDVYIKMLENRAFVFYKMNRFNEAINDYALILENNPKRKDIKQTIANILLRQGNIQVAYHQLRFLLKEDSMFCDAWNSLGNYYSSINKADSALWAYKKAINCEQKSLYYYNRATLLSQKNRLEEATTDFNKAISIDSTVSEYYINRAINYYKQKYFNLALSDFNHAIKLNSKNADYYLNRCNVYIALEKWDEAIEDLTKAINLTPNDGNIYARRSYIYYQLGLKEKACLDAQKTLQLGFEKYKTWAEKICN
jgi:tetratricopeptide (TPR) repeat protein